MPVIARHIDPRDQRWQVDHPSYRVYFWQRLGDAEDSGWTSEEWELEGADVAEALEWANEQSHGRSFVLYASVPSASIPNETGIGLITLLGVDPTV